MHTIPYGGLLASRLAAGETVLISGATGNLGSSAVTVALAMGAGHVVTPGRNRAALDLLADRFGPRVSPVELSGDEDTDRASMAAATDGPIDIVLVLLPPQAPSSAARAAAMTVREYGRGCADGWRRHARRRGPRPALPLDHAQLGDRTRPMDVPTHGERRHDPTHRDGAPWTFTPEHVTRFDLDQVNDAVTHAATHGAPFDRTVANGKCGPA